MKTKEELNAIKEEVETLNKKLAELTDEEIAYVSGGSNNESSNSWEDWVPELSKSPEGNWMNMIT